MSTRNRTPIDLPADYYYFALTPNDRGFSIKTFLQPDLLSALGTVSGMVLTHRAESVGARAKYRDIQVSPLQRLARAAFYSADAHWQQLIPQFKDAWRAWRKWDRLHGYPLFMRCNIPRARSSLPLLDLPPDIPPWH